MYRIPDDLDLSEAVGEFTTQIRVGQFDLQFTFGKVDIAIESSISLIREGGEIGKWEAGKWPDPQFFEIININVVKYEIPNDRLIVLYFDNGIEMHLTDNSDQFECMQISIAGENQSQWII